MCNTVVKFVFNPMGEGMVDSLQTLQTLLNLAMCVTLVYKRKICSQKPHCLTNSPLMITISCDRIGPG
jgi:hypothetical protein